MIYFLNALKVDFKRSLFNIKFISIIICEFLLLLWAAWDDLKFGDADVVYYFQISNISAFSSISLILATIPLSVGFCEDWNSKNIWNINMRGTLRTYCYSKCICCMLSGGIAIVIGQLIYILYLVMIFPIVKYNRGGALISPIFYKLIDNSLYVKYFFYCLLLIFLRNALAALIAFFTSLYITNSFVTMVSPLIIWYIITFVANKSSIPSSLNIPYILSGYYNAGSPLNSMLYILILSFLLIFILIWQANKHIRKRIEE